MRDLLSLPRRSADGEAIVSRLRNNELDGDDFRRRFAQSSGAARYWPSAPGSSAGFRPHRRIAEVAADLIVNVVRPARPIPASSESLCSYPGPVAMNDSPDQAPPHPDGCGPDVGKAGPCCLLAQSWLILAPRDGCRRLAMGGRASDWRKPSNRSRNGWPRATLARRRASSSRRRRNR